MPPPTREDLELALNRLLADHRRTRHDHSSARTFVSNPVELGLIESVRAAWLDRLAAAVQAGEFHPSQPLLFDVPKGYSAVRTGCLPSLTDQVVYTACVGRLFEQIRGALVWADPQKDYSYQLAESDTSVWIRSRFRCWEDFRVRSLAKLQDGPTLVLFTDIASFYDNIAIELLASDLRAAGADTDIVGLLVRCLSRWAVVNGRGVPQGFSASDLLAKLYLNVVDRAFADLGYDHIRYVDDFRIFCSSRGEARRAVLDLARLIRRRGLSLVGGKTAFLTPADARNRFEGAIPTLRPLSRRYVREIAEAAGTDSSGLSLSDAEQLLEELGIDPPTDMLHEAYSAYFLDARATFDKTLFHFILNRLGKAGDAFATEHALSLLRDHPEETEAVLDYIGKVVTVTSIEPRLLEFLKSDEAIYPYQHYEIISWRVLFDQQPSEEFMRYVRDTVRSEVMPSFVRASGRHVLAKFGTDADIEVLAAAYPAVASEGERAEALCAIYRMERGRRNALLGQARNDGFLAAAAVTLVREERVASLLTDGAG